jgi:alpha-tubulin suppressor-like RCC1 family protein
MTRRMKKWWFWLLFFLAHFTGSSFALTVDANFTSAATIPVTVASYAATGNTVNLTLGFAPATGTNLTLVKNTGIGFIQGTFSNLAQGQQVDLSYGGKSYQFVTNYYGGSGNDLVLHWQNTGVVDSAKFQLDSKLVVSVSAGASHNLALCSDGMVVAWGANGSGQLGKDGPNSRSNPVSVNQTGGLSGKTVVSVSGGSSLSLALCSDGTVAAWGANGSGQLGNGSMMTNSSVPVLVNHTGVLSGRTVVAISAGPTNSVGGSHNLALCSDGTVVAWGANESGQLGNGSMTNSSVPVLVNQTGVLNGKTVVAVFAGSRHSLALCSDGTVTAWGDNGSDQLGNGTTFNSSIPVLVDQTGVLSGKSVVALAAGNSHSLALCSDGTLAAWGANGSGQLGDGSTFNSSVPVLVNQTGVLNGKTVVAVFTGGRHSLALCSDGTVAAWGANEFGQLGNGTSFFERKPLLLNRTGYLNGKTVVAVSAGSEHSLALCSDGTVAAWGRGGGGRLGNGSTTSSSVPVMVSQIGVLSGKTVVEVSAGGGHNLALCSDGRVAAWGLNSSGQLGNGSTADIYVPVFINQAGVLSGKTVVAVSAGGVHSLALCSDGTVAAWGLNSSGQLGNGSTTNSSVPVLVDQTGVLSGKIVVAVSAGGSHNLALCSDGTLVAWGYNGDGQLGNGSTTNTSVPVLVKQSGVLSGKKVVGVSAGNRHSLALCSDGTVAAWGGNWIGQLGNGSTTSSSVPVMVNQTGALSGKTVVDVSSGADHSLALCSDGTVAAWGLNSSGQLGNASTAYSSVPVLVNQTGVLSGKIVVAVSAGGFHNLALCSDGTVAAWGYNGDGHLGDGSMTNTSVPVLVNQSGFFSSKVSAGGDGSLSIIGLSALAQSTLSSLVVSDMPIAPSFLPDVKTYEVSVPSAKSFITISSTAENPTAAIYINGKKAISGSASSPISLRFGVNVVYVVLIAENGSIRTVYVVNIGRFSDVASLSGLALSSGMLSPVFSPTTTAYAVSVLNTVSSITMTPTMTDTTASVKINGNVVTSGSASQTIPLSVGSNTITAYVTAQNGTTTNAYTVTVIRAASNVSALSSLVISDGSMSPIFASDTLNYTASVANSISAITVTPTTTNAFATVRVNGTLVASGSASQSLPLNVGSNTINVIGTAQDGTTTSAYTLLIKRFSNVATLSSLALGRGTMSPGFSTNTTNYTAAVANTITSVTVTPTLTESTATVRVNGALVTSGNASQSIPLGVGSNVISIVGIAQDGTTTSMYTINVFKYQLALVNAGIAEGGAFATSWDTGDVTKAMLTATPLTGFLFASWTGDASGNTNPLTITMNSDKTVGATFVRDFSDSDGDGLTAYDELLIYGTNPAVFDSDGDGLSDGWELGIGRFSIVTGSFTWQQARDDARGKGGDLASFPTEDRWNRAMQNLGVNPFERFTGLWIGASDAMVEGTWLWVNGEAFSYSSWGSDRPSLTTGSTLDFAEVSGGGGAEIGKWYDRSSSAIREGYLLETGYATSPLVPDADGDGLNDGQELAAGTNPGIVDTDADGLSDGQEVNLTKTNPKMADSNSDGINDANSDQDGDGLNNLAEITEYSTNPIKVDTDGDGLRDDFEIGFGRFALVSTRLTWSQAKADAATRGGHLATFTSAVEYERMREKIGIFSLDALDGAWVGASDEGVDGTWQWANGEQSGNFVIPWGTGRPSNLNGNTLDYSEISGGDGTEIWKWYDRTTATTRASYILETGFPTDPLIADTDGDGISDGLETSRGLMPTIADMDGDGWNDGVEQDFGGNPRSASILPIFQCKLNTAPVGNQWILRFPAAIGQVYTIEVSENLSSWNSLESNITGSGNIVTRAYPFTPALPKLYFRVKQN